MRVILRLLVFGCAFATAGNATAQTKFAGKCSQGKPDPNHVVRVADGANHVMTLGQVTCTWSSGDIAGAALKDEIDTVVSDMKGTTSHDRGYGVGSAASGDKYYVRFDGTTTLKFVLTHLDSFVGQRMSVTGMLIGAGGANGINVTTVNRVGEACP